MSKKEHLLPTKKLLSEAILPVDIGQEIPYKLLFINSII